MDSADIPPNRATPAEGQDAPVSPGSDAGIDASIFRAYDIRGVVGRTLTPEVAARIGRAFGSEIRERGGRQVVVGRDGRLSSAALGAALEAGIRASGCDVIDLGVVPTPAVYFAVEHLGVGNGVMVTGSHNPPDYNGFKLVAGGAALTEDEIRGLQARIREGRLTRGSGRSRSVDITGEYLDRLVRDARIRRPLRVAVDCGNGVAGRVVPRLLRRLGIDAEELYCEVDGHFPNHHPNPGDPGTLERLREVVRLQALDVGIAFDGDGDRLGVVDDRGRIIWADRLLMLFARDILARRPGAKILFDVKCTRHLEADIRRHGGEPLMWKSGHSRLKHKLRETGGALAGEMSGHIFFGERWYGFDDALYAAVRLLEILSATDRPAAALFDELPEDVSTPELAIPFGEGERHRFMAALGERAEFGPGARVTRIDGLRVDFPDGWGLVRASNTTPSVTLRFEADDESALARIQALFREQLLGLRPDLALPF